MISKEPLLNSTIDPVIASLQLLPKPPFRSYSKVLFFFLSSLHSPIFFFFKFFPRKFEHTTRFELVPSPDFSKISRFRAFLMGLQQFTARFFRPTRGFGVAVGLLLVVSAEFLSIGAFAGHVPSDLTSLYALFPELLLVNVEYDRLMPTKPKVFRW